MLAVHELKIKSCLFSHVPPVNSCCHLYVNPESIPGIRISASIPSVLLFKETCWKSRRCDINWLKVIAVNLKRKFVSHVTWKTHTLELQLEQCHDLIRNENGKE